jgi:hypothetical protein
VEAANHDILLLKKARKEIIQKGLIGTGKNERHFRRIEMQSLTAYFGLALQAGENKLRKLLVVLIRTEYQNATYKLRQ